MTSFPVLLCAVVLVSVVSATLMKAEREDFEKALERKINRYQEINQLRHKISSYLEKEKEQETVAQLKKTRDEIKAAQTEFAKWFYKVEAKRQQLGNIQRLWRERSWMEASPGQPQQQARSKRFRFI